MTDDFHDKNILMVVPSVAIQKHYVESIESLCKVVCLSSFSRFQLAIDDCHPCMIIVDADQPLRFPTGIVNTVQTNPYCEMVPIIYLMSHGRNDLRLLMRTRSLINDLIFKPVYDHVLLRHARTSLVISQRNLELRDRGLDMVNMLKGKLIRIGDSFDNYDTIATEMIEFNDIITGSYTNNYFPRYMSTLLGGSKEAGIYHDEIEDWDTRSIAMSRLHDIGKIGISDAIIAKPGKLTADEYDIMKCHTMIGKRLIRMIMNVAGNSKPIKQAELFITHHHERWDGNGYPYGSSGTSIPLEGRVASIIDAYDAITSKRSYKEPRTHEEACQIINSEAGTQFDPQLVTAFNFISDKLATILHS